MSAVDLPVIELGSDDGDRPDREDALEHGVLLGRDFLERWLPRLTPGELRAYLALAAAGGDDPLGEARRLADRDAAVQPLVDRGLIETLERDGRVHVNFLHRDRHGVHRAEPARGRLADALAFLDSMEEELRIVADRDDSPELREEVFRRHPELRNEFELYERDADESAPGLRLWLELSRFSTRVFEERFGVVRDDHRDLFRRTTERALAERVALIERVTRELLDRRGELFPEIGDGFVVVPEQRAITESEPVVGLADRYGFGPDLLYASLIEALQQEGAVIISTGPSGDVDNLLLPATTGLAVDDERHLLAGPSGDKRERAAWSTLRRRYADHLADRAAAALAEFARRDRVPDIDALLFQVAAAINEALEDLEPDPGAGLGGASYHVESVVAAYDRVKAAGR